MAYRQSKVQTLTSLARLVFGLVARRRRKRHPRSRGGQRIQESKARKAMKEAARLALLSEEESRAGQEYESRTAERLSHLEDEPSGRVDADVEPPIEGSQVERTVEAMRTVEADSEALGPAEGTSMSTPSQKDEPCGDLPEGALVIVVEDTTEASWPSSQPALPSRRRRRRNREATGVVKSPTIPSTIMESGVARIVEHALHEAAGSFGTAPPRARSRRPRR